MKVLRWLPVLSVATASRTLGVSRKEARDGIVQLCQARQPRMRAEPHRLVFIDETNTPTRMTCLRGRTRRGERLRADAPFGHWKVQTFIAGLRHDGLTAP